jgi:capsular exopolysaccharide synthesis family protein
MTDRPPSSPDWPRARLEHLRPARDAAQLASASGSPPDNPPYDPDDTPSARPAHLLLLRALAALRRRWLLALSTTLLVLVPVTSYAILAVPTYTAEGVLQVSSQGNTVNPLLELAGAGAASPVETEVEIVRRRDFVLSVLKELRLHLRDPHQPSLATTDLAIAVAGSSPVRQSLRDARAALHTLDVHPTTFGVVPLSITATDDTTLGITVGDPQEDPRYYETPLGTPVEDPALTIQFDTLPIAVGDTLELEALSDGQLVEQLVPKLGVSSIGTARQSTNLVTVRFTDPDRETAQSVVQAIMQRYLDQSLQWQALSASNAADFIAQRLEEAQKQLTSQEETLRQFAEKEHAVQLDTQAELTITSSAELEADLRKIELQEKVIGTVLSGLSRKAPGTASITSNFFEDPVLAAAVGALNEAETQHAVLRATLTPDHPQVISTAKQIDLHQKEIARLLRSSRKNLTQQRKELQSKIDEAMSSLAAYPDKELQLARHTRDVEVGQKLYAFLLEKFQEAEILEASTTIDKRIVDAANLPHRKTTPKRAQLVLTGALGGLALAFAAVYLAHLLQRRLQTIEAVKESIPYAVYGTVPAVDRKAANGKKRGQKRGKKGADDPGKRLTPAALWAESHGSPAEAFRAMAVNVSLAPGVEGRGRIIQVTSAQPGEGKSTTVSNLAVALSSSGARVLLVDLDLRKPVQHRAWSLRRAPGYSDLVAQGGGPSRAVSLLQHEKQFDIDVLTAGARLPDTLGALMGATLESMLAFWATRYDYVLVDAPPVFVADTAIIGRHADLVLLVARPGVLERGPARQAVESLARLDVHKGLVLNGVERKHADSYYEYGGYAYAQAYGIAADQDDKQAAGS